MVASSWMLERRQRATHEQRNAESDACPSLLRHRQASLAELEIARG